MLGEPSDKYGGGRFRAVGISYETLGVDIQFKERGVLFCWMAKCGTGSQLPFWA